MLQKRHLAAGESSVRRRRPAAAERPRLGAGEGHQGHGTAATSGALVGRVRTARFRRLRDRCRRAADCRFGFRLHLALLLDPDLFFERALQLVGGPLELRRGSCPAIGPVPEACGGRRMIRAITKMMISSGMPMEPNIGLLTVPTTWRDSPASIIGNGCLKGQGKVRPGRPEVIAHEEVICYDATHATFPARFRRRVRRRGVRAGRRPLRAQRAGDRREGPRALQDLHRGAERHRVELRRKARFRPARLRRDSRDARRRSTRIRASSTRTSTRRCASGRKAATTASASRFRRSTATSRRASVFEGSPAYKVGMRRGDVIARIGGEDAKGWTTEQAMLKLRGPKGTPVEIEIRRRGYEQPIPLDRHARRGPHPHRPGGTS